MWALILIGIVDALVFLLARKQVGFQGGEQLAAMFAMNVTMLGWCYVDAEEKKVPVSGWLRLAMLALPIIGVPWYFLSSRGFVAAAKTGFGLGLFAVWFASLLLSSIVVVVAQILLSK